MTKTNKEKSENAKITLILKRKQAVMLKVAAKVQRISQGEVVGYLLDLLKKDATVVTKFCTEVEKNRKTEEEFIKEIKEL